ncbi:MAG: DsbA family protein [Mariprofundaceae bacterium]|nr:DsbA family protein [Mariprofundaceae bacterium]
MRLYYIHDPMCSWCWAFRPVWQALKRQLPTALSVSYVLGGLAPDSHSPMSLGLQRQIQQHWRTIQQRVPGTMLNFEFWQENIPRRSTYPACRAVIAAKYQGEDYEDAMILAIQQAYYLHAKNPSNDDVLLACAASLNLDMQGFESDLNSAACKQQLMTDIRLSQSLGAEGFPSLVLDIDGIYHFIAVDYSHADTMLEKINGEL